MDDYLNKPTVLKIIAFLITIFMFIQVSNSEISQKLRKFQVASKNQTVVIEKIPVQIYYDEDNLVVSGVPDTVDVKISGPKSIVLQAKAQRDFQVAVYLTDPDIGNQKISFVTKNLSDKLTATIMPGYVTVNVQEKVSKSFAVEPLLKDVKLEEGYSIEEATVVPEKVVVIGGKDVVQKIAHVYAVWESKDKISKDTKQEVKLIAVDSKSNKLNVVISPNTVEMNVKLKMPSKTVPIQSELKGEPQEGYFVESVVFSKSDVTIYSKDASFNNITAIMAPIDVSGKSETFETEVTLSVPDGIAKLSQTSIKATVTISLEASRIIHDVPIKVINIDTQHFDVKLLDLDKLDVTVRGTSQAISEIQAGQISIIIDGTNLEVGKKSIKVKVTGPDTVKYSLSIEEVQIEVSKK